MLIVIDGPDGSGKTTLARHLQEKHGATYHHDKGPPEAEDLVAYFLSLLARGGIIDRFALSEMVYGPLLRGRSRIDINDFFLLMHELRNLGGRHIV